MTCSDQVVTCTFGQIFNISRSNYSSINVSRQGEHDAGNTKMASLQSQKLLPKKKNLENGYIWSFYSLEDEPDLRSNLRTPLRKSVKRAIECAFPRLCSSSGYRVSYAPICRKMLKRAKISPLMISADLTFVLTLKITEAVS